jgi:hypothetical protein
LFCWPAPVSRRRRSARHRRRFRTVRSEGAINPPQWRLTDTQRGAIAAAVRHDKRAAEPSISFVPSVGAPVPPAIELYMLPDKILAEVPATRSVKYTVMKNQLVLVDPTTMRVVDIIPH